MSFVSSILFQVIITFALIFGNSTTVFAEPLYKGKTVTIIVPFTPGGGWDTYARLASRHMSKHLTGNPSIIVQNMPGAGGVIAANFVYHRAKSDGRTIGMFQTTNAFLQLVGDPAVRFDVKKFNWIGAFSFRVSTCVAATDSPFRSIQDVIGSKEPMIAAAAGRGSGPGKNSPEGVQQDHGGSGVPGRGQTGKAVYLPYQRGCSGPYV